MQVLTSCEPLEALNDALCREEESRDFYEKAAQRTQNTSGTEMFESLAAQAKTQAGLLEAQIDSLTADNTWTIPECALNCTFDLDTHAFPHGQAEFEKAISPAANELDAITYALKAENLNYQRYAEMANSCVDEQACKFLTYLAEQTYTRMNLLMLNFEKANQGWM